MKLKLKPPDPYLLILALVLLGGVALAETVPPPGQREIDDNTIQFVKGFLDVLLNLNDFIVQIKGQMSAFQDGAYTIGRSLIAVGFIWSMIRAVYYGSLEEILAAMARVVLAGGFLWFGEVLESAIDPRGQAENSLYTAVFQAYRDKLTEQIGNAAANLKALGAVVHPLFTILALVEAGVLNLIGTALEHDIGNDFFQRFMVGTGTALQFLNPATIALLPFIAAAMVFTVLIIVMFQLAVAFFPIVAGSLALPIGLGGQLFGRWLSVVVWAFIMSAVGPGVVAGALYLGVNKPAAYITAKAKEVVEKTVESFAQQSRENRARLAEKIWKYAKEEYPSRHNGRVLYPEKCGFEIKQPHETSDGKWDYKFTGEFEVKSAVVCSQMRLEGFRYTMAQVANLTGSLLRAVLDMFQAWLQTLVLFVVGMMAALMITGYLATLISTFFGGLGIQVGAVASGSVMRQVGQMAQTWARDTKRLANTLGKLGKALGGGGGGPSGGPGGGPSGGGGGGVPPAYERPAQASEGGGGGGSTPIPRYASRGMTPVPAYGERGMTPTSGFAGTSQTGSVAWGVRSYTREGGGGTPSPAPSPGGASSTPGPTYEQSSRTEASTWGGQTATSTGEGAYRSDWSGPGKEES